MSEPTKDNPLTHGTPQSLLPQPCVLVIFGARRRSVVAQAAARHFTTSMLDGVLPSNFAVVGFGIGCHRANPTNGSAPAPRDGIQHFSRQPLDESHWDDFARALFYVEGSFNDARAYDQLKAKLDAVDQQFGIPGSRVYLPVDSAQPGGRRRRPSQRGRHGQPLRTTTMRSPASSSKSRSAAIWTAPARSTPRSATPSPKTRPIASTITSARKRCRT